jgi:carbon monoxide dehydrogenase subunit G
MASFRAALAVPGRPEKIFEYLSDFARVADWDPGIVESERIGEGPVRVGTEFRVISSFLGLRVPLRYEVTAFDAPRRIVLRGEGDRVRALDEISLEPTESGTRIVWQARVDLLGRWRLLDGILDLVFQRVGERAVRGLALALGVR